MSSGSARRIRLGDCLEEVTAGVGPSWSGYRLLGATREGLAAAKEPVGKNPERYKLVEPGTIFYNPMRILIGSIAYLGEGEEAGITSPDYVVFTTKPGELHSCWFYFWLRSDDGAAFIRTLARGAVRERMLFRRLANAEIEVPPFPAQVSCAKKVQFLERVRAAAETQLRAVTNIRAAELRAVFAGPNADRWDWKPVDQLLAEPMRTGISRPQEPASSRYCLTLSAVRNGRLDTAARKPVAVTEEEATKNCVRAGAFYVVRGNGNRSLVGRGAFAPAEMESLVLYPDLLIQMVLKSDLVEAPFFQAAWDNPRTRADLEARTNDSR